jgi:hypothetical protein
MEPPRGGPIATTPTPSAIPTAARTSSNYLSHLFLLVASLLFVLFGSSWAPRLIPRELPSTPAYGLHLEDYLPHPDDAVRRLPRWMRRGIARGSVKSRKYAMWNTGAFRVPCLLTSVAKATGRPLGELLRLCKSRGLYRLCGAVSSGYLDGVDVRLLSCLLLKEYGIALNVLGVKEEGVDGPARTRLFSFLATSRFGAPVRLGAPFRFGAPGGHRIPSLAAPRRAPRHLLALLRAPAAVPVGYSGSRTAAAPGAQTTLRRGEGLADLRPLCTSMTQRDGDG